MEGVLKMGGKNPGGKMVGLFCTDLCVLHLSSLYRTLLCRNSAKKCAEELKMPFLATQLNPPFVQAPLFLTSLT